MKALLLIDIQNDFLPGGSLAVRDGDAIIPVVNRLAPRYDHVVVTQDWHPADHLSFASQHPGRRVGEMIQLDGLDQILWPDHCVQGTRGAELAPALDAHEIDHVILKGTDRTIDSYSGFFDNARRKATGLESHLHNLGVNEIHIAGLATDYCVRFTAIDGASLGFRVFVLEDAIRGVELNPGDCGRAFDEMRAAGVVVSTSQEVAINIVRGRASDMSNEDDVRTLHAGRHLTLVARNGWEFATRNTRRPAVGIVAITADECVVLVEQPRPPVGQNVIELPAGLAGDLADAKDEALLEAAKRELLEETGYVATQWTELGQGFSSPGLTDESIVLFLAEDLEKTGAGGGDASESITVHEIPLVDVASWLAARCAAIDMKLLAGLYAAQECRKNRIS